MDGDSAPRSKIAGDGCRPGPACLNQVVKDFVNHLFMKTAVVAVGKKVYLQRFAFYAERIGNVLDGYGSKIGLSGDGAEGGKFRAVESYHVIPAGVGILEGFQRGLFGAGWHRCLAGFQQ